MKTVTVLSAPPTSRKPKVKKLLIKGNIYLTSEKFAIFVTVIASIMCWIAALDGNDALTAASGFLYVIGVTPWIIRETMRSRYKKIK